MPTIDNGDELTNIRSSFSQLNDLSTMLTHLGFLTGNSIDITDPSQGSFNHFFASKTASQIQFNHICKRRRSLNEFKNPSRSTALGSRSLIIFPMVSSF